MERIVRHRQSKEPATDRPLLTYRATFRLHYGVAAEILGENPMLPRQPSSACNFFLRRFCHSDVIDTEGSLIRSQRRLELMPGEGSQIRVG